MEDKFKNLIKLLKLFDGKPNYLCKYLIENSALSEKFIKDLESNKKLNELVDPENLNIDFKSISEMNEFYNSLSSNDQSEFKSYKQQMSKLIKEERYEEAAKLRDFNKKNNYK
jgi:hypothetical protein